MKTIICIFSIVLMAIFLAGCSTTGRVEMDYGTSYKLAKFNQVLNPDAEKDLEPVAELDGEAAQKVVETYLKSFEKPAPPPPSVLLGVSGGGTR
ncbi:MAG: hypothetical protein PHT96_10350 [Syntrophorhabdaceae bacterium]|nr:hypothetical protein [Syntrophorhabdaceae bacterium]